MKRLMPIFIVILLSGCGILTAYAPNMLSMIVVAVMGVVVLLGIIYGPFFQTEENGPVVSGIQGQGKAAAPEWTDRQ